MKRSFTKTFSLLLALLVLCSTLLTGCASSGGVSGPNTNAPSDVSSANQEAAGTSAASAASLTVRFGSGGEAFALHLEDNQTAKDIAHHVGTADWQLPIYHYDD